MRFLKNGKINKERFISRFIENDKKSAVSTLVSNSKSPLSPFVTIFSYPRSLTPMLPHNK